MGAVWLRIIMTCVYNSYQAHTLIYSQFFLQNAESKSYTDYQQYKKNSFSRFCYLLAQDLHLQLKDDINNNKNNAITIDSNDDCKLPAKKKSYNKRVIYFGEKDLASLRLNPHLDRNKVRIVDNIDVNEQDEDNPKVGGRYDAKSKQERCVRCCSFKHHLKEAPATV
jgi:hypothetical protein